MSEFSKAFAKPAGIGVAVLIGAALVYWLVGSKLKGAAVAVGTAINPASQQNLVNRAVTAVGSAISGRDSWSLGSWIYDVTHDDPNLVSDPKPATAEEAGFWSNLTSKIGGG